MRYRTNIPDMDGCDFDNVEACVKAVREVLCWPEAVARRAPRRFATWMIFEDAAQSAHTVGKTRFEIVEAV